MNIDAPVLHDVASLKNLWREAFGDTDEFIELFFTNAYEPERCRTITENGELCAALYFFDCEYDGNKLAYIYAVATANKHRGRGLCHMLMEDTHEFLANLGYAGALLVPGSKSLFAFYESMGYKTCGFVREFGINASDQTMPLRKLGADEYAELRRKYLPENGVLQEGVSLDFLESYTELYAYPDGVLAASIEDDVLRCAEILGDTSAASGIVGSLGCRMGNFRTVGDDKPFAMYRSFEGAENRQVYFGLAFD